MIRRLLPLFALALTLLTGCSQDGFKDTDIVSITVYVTDVNDVAKMNAVYGKNMPSPKPARATVQVAALIGGAKIEISAIAVKH